MQNKAYISPSKSSSRSFTLIELIIVIIIVAILAAVGLTQYTKVVEKGREAEARQILGVVYKLARQYYLENGTVTTITLNDMNIGTDADQIPLSCRSSHYFYYTRGSSPTDNYLYLRAYRCREGGKEPQGSFNYLLTLIVNMEAGTATWWWQAY